jgi:RND family efflux transporter MFP subunit
MRKRGTWIVLIGALLLTATGGYVAYVRSLSPVSLADEPPEPTLETETVTQGDIVLTIDGSGELVPAAELELSFRTGGVLDQVLVEVGDQVKEDDVLARLETEELERAVAVADVEVQLAQLELADVREGPSDAELADARAALRDAQVELELARAAYENTSDSALDEAVHARRNEFEWYRGYYWEQKQEFEKGDISQSDHDHAMNALISAEGRLNEAINQALTEEAQAENRVEQAQNKVYQASENLQLLESEPLTDTLVRAELAVDQALLVREKALAALEAAQLYAPFDGTVMEVTESAGERVGTATPILTLANLQDPLLCFWVEETDMAKVAVGDVASIVFEALPDDTFTGEIIRVDPLLVTVDNTPAVQAWASVDLSAQEATLLSGMTADIEIVVAETRNALLVPVEALRETSPDQYTVFVVKSDGELEMREIEVGLKDFMNAEILSGLELGEVVSVGEME